MTKEEYKKNLTRYFDSVRRGEEAKNYMGTALCCGVACTTCMFAYLCEHIHLPEKALDCVELLEKWVKEHPVITNKDKFKEVFGVEPDDDSCPPVSNICGVAKYLSDCNACRRWWDEEYKGDQNANN